MLRPVFLPCSGSALAAASLASLLAPTSARADVLYSLDTMCSLRSAAPVPCRVEVLNENDATLYRHRIGTVTETIRITDAPVRMALWDGNGKEWKSLTGAAARFSTNTVCFNGRDLCVVNPNYLNSVRQQNAPAMAGRDLVKVHFGPDGRIDATCYDQGCEVKLP